jgi:molybdenum cofactor cytidylyltransferase
MKIIDAIRPTSQTRLAFVGAGGKMEAIVRLAEQISGPVLVATSTHLGVDQSIGEGRRFMVRTREDLALLRDPLQDGVTLVTGSEADGKWVAGLPFVLLEEVNEIAHSHNLPLLILTDGSTQKALEAPIEHEPEIPEFVDTVIVMTGLNGLGQPLSEATVHIPERFGKMLGLKLGEAVTSQALLKVLTHPEGGLKNIPPDARRMVFLDQANTPEKAAVARGMVKPLQEVFEVVLVGDMAQQQDELKAAFVRVAGVVLAAGESTRMKTPKQLLEWQGQPFVRVAAEKARKAGLDPVVVVAGAYRELVEEAVGDLVIDLVHNPEWKAGQSTSVKAGIDALPEGIGAVIFFLVDQPKIPVNFIETLLDTHTRTLASIVAPMVDYQRNNPVLFDRVTFKDFSAIEGDAGGRQIFSKHQVTWVPWVDSSVFIDVDTMEDYHKLNE